MRARLVASAALLAVSAAAQLATPPFRTLGAGLTYGLLSPPAEEWNSTFGGAGGCGGRVHVWLRCLNWTARAYYFVEVDQSPLWPARQTVSVLASGLQDNSDGTWVLWPDVFTANGQPVRAFNTQHGGEWFVAVPRGAPLGGSLAVGVTGWVRFALRSRVLGALGPQHPPLTARRHRSHPLASSVPIL